MSDVHEPPEGANDDDPPPPWRPSDPSRWSMLGLQDPDPTGRPPKGGKVADVLAWALLSPGSTDPIEGIVDDVRNDLVALSGSFHGTDEPPADILMGCVRRLWAAMKLLRWCDNRERMPVDNELPSVAKVMAELAQQAGASKQLLDWLTSLQQRAPEEQPPPASTKSIRKKRGADPDEPPSHE